MTTNTPDGQSNATHVNERTAISFIFLHRFSNSIFYLYSFVIVFLK